MGTDLHKPTARVLDILNTLVEVHEGATLTEISSATGYSKGTIFPILKALVEYKYVQINESLRYNLGLRACTLSSAFTYSNQWLAFIHDEMQKIVKKCDEVCQLGVIEGDEILYIDKVQSRRMVQLLSFIGKRLPAAKTALGKALLASLPEAEIQNFFLGEQRQVEKLKNDIAFVKEHGYAVDDREINDETKCYAVPLFHKGSPIAALSVSLPFYRDTAEAKELILQELFDKKKEIEKAFNTYTPPITLYS